MTYARQFGKLGPGYQSTTDPIFRIVQAYLNLAANVEVAIGTGVISTGLTNAHMQQVNIPTADAQIFYGVILNNETAYTPPGQTDNTVKGTQLINVMTMGKCTVATSVDVTDVNALVYLEFAAGAGRGKFRPNNTGSVGTLVPGARWLSTSSGGGAELELRY